MTVDELPDEVSNFLYEYFRSEYNHNSADVAPEENERIDRMIENVSNALDGNVGELGMAIDFVVLAEELSQVDAWPEGPNLGITKSDILDHYDTKDVSTLTILYEGSQYGIRPVQNEVRDLFIYELRRTSFPSSPGHHTGNWEEYDDYLEIAFQLSRPGRFEALKRLFKLGLNELYEKRFESRETQLPQPFIKIISDYQRSHPDENGGLAFQAIAYGYVKAEWPHLSLRTSGVRTGSERQNRYGDVDGFYGPDLMLSVEVKDKEINSTNVSGELGTMLGIAEDTTAIPLAIVREITNSAREELENAGVEVLGDEDLIESTQRWDFYKQNRAVHGMLHYLANVEEDGGAVQRLLAFLEDIDEKNRALDHYIDM